MGWSVLELQLDELSVVEALLEDVAAAESVNDGPSIVWWADQVSIAQNAASLAPG